MIFNVVCGSTDSIYSTGSREAVLSKSIVPRREPCGRPFIIWSRDEDAFITRRFGPTMELGSVPFVIRSGDEYFHFLNAIITEKIIFCS